MRMHGGIAVDGDVARRDLHLERLGLAVAEPLHDLARLGPALLDVGGIAGQRLQHLRRHAPLALGRRQHDAADVVLAVAQDVDEGLAVEGQRHRLADLGIVEGRGLRIDDQVGGDVGGRQLADRLRRLGLDVLEQRDRDVGAERHVELAGHERQDARRAVLDHLPVDAVEVGLALLPVVGVAHELDRVAALELDELEGPVPIGLVRMSLVETWQG